VTTQAGGSHSTRHKRADVGGGEGENRNGLLTPTPGHSLPETQGLTTDLGHL